MFNKLYPGWDEKEWECTACGKRKKLKYNDVPINYIEKENGFE